jgi:predicted cupin superfamily sugar epimerase
MNGGSSGASRADVLIRALNLAPHPEGGHFRELFRSGREVQAPEGRSSRSAVTTIYYLLATNELSRWHSVEADEVWHLYEGGPLELFVAPPHLDRVERRRLAAVGEAGEPVTVVPAKWWQAARPMGDYALAGCTVAPGFEFADFRLLRDDPEARAALERLGPECLAFL